MIDFSEAQEIFYREMREFRLPVEKVPVRDARGRVLAAPVRSRLDSPPFTRSAMDGYAIRKDDVQEEYRVLETIRAGDIGTEILESGTCIKIMTGAPVPEGAGKVVPVEDVEVVDRKIRVIRRSKATHICEKGEDLRSGDVIAEEGNRLDARMLALLVSCGIDTVEAYRPVRAAVFSTGDEILAPGEEWRPGKIHDANSPLLENLLQDRHAEVIRRGHLPDEMEKATEHMDAAIKEADLVCFSGGVSEGDYDLMPGVLRNCGIHVHFSRLRVKPGKPMTFATGRDTVVLGFPGNPVSTYLMFHIFGVPALESYCGHPVIPEFIRLKMATSHSRSKAERMEFVPATLNEKSRIVPVEYHGSGHLAAVRGIDGFFILKPGDNSVSKGEKVFFWLLSRQGYRSRDAD